MNASKLNNQPNILTFDIEEWFHANYEHINPAQYRGKGSNFKAQIDTLLQMCSDTGCTATFFVLGSIGEDYPDTVRLISQEGHEIASHGYAHELAYRQTINEFQADVKKSIHILSDITGKQIMGYRAPSWSIIESNLHYLTVLEALDLKYDASIFPVKTFLYGIPNARTDIHKPYVNGRELELYEIPMSVVDFWGKRLGYSGGFYFRLFPGFCIKKVINAANRGGHASIVYLHPREIDATERKLDLPFLESFIHYYGIKAAKAKLDEVMRSFHFTSVSEHLTKLNIKI